MKKADSALLQSLIVSEQELSDKLNSADLASDFSDLEKEATSILDKVKFPEFSTSQEVISLLMLYWFKGKLLDKDVMAKVGSSFLGKNHSDWQIRHLAAQKGFHILGKGDLIPNTNLKCPSGFHMLLSLNSISPKYATIKRTDLLEEGDFDKVKLLFENRCAHCNSKENDTNFRDSVKTKLQKGHIDPNQSLDVGNIIPLCDYCNRTYKDTYLFLNNGAIDKVNVYSERVCRLLIDRMKIIQGKEKIMNWLNF